MRATTPLRWRSVGSSRRPARTGSSPSCIRASTSGCIWGRRLGSAAGAGLPRSGESGGASSRGEACRRRQWRRYRQRALSVLSYVGALVALPAHFVEDERHTVAHLLHLPGSALPRRGHLELAAERNWPDVGNVEAAVVVEARLRAERTRATWKLMEGILRGTLDSRPLVQMARPARYDVSWPGMPMALYSKALVEEDAGSSAALRAVARVGGEERRKGSRKSCERQVERAMCADWVADAIVQRSARIHIDDGSLDGVDLVLADSARLSLSFPRPWR